jgi:hypothetical protein
MKNVVIFACLGVVVICLLSAFCLGVDAYRTECMYLIGLCELCVIAALVLAFVDQRK